VESIWLGRKYHVPQWIRRGYTRICIDESLSPTDLGEPPQQPRSRRLLDWKTIAYLCHIRNEINKLGKPNSPIPSNLRCVYCTGVTLYWNTGSICCQSCRSYQNPAPLATNHTDTLVSHYFKEELDILVSTQ